MTEPSEQLLPRNIILAGFMGTGKSSVGRELARRLNWKFVDADDLIEARAGKTIPKIFEELGEEGFRKLEREVLEGLKELRQHVVATGGGAVVNEANRQLLDQSGRLILLTASEETIWGRVRHARHRPLLAGENPRKRLGELLDARREAYAQIQTQVATDGKAVKQIATEIVSLFSASE